MSRNSLNFLILVWFVIGAITIYPLVDPARSRQPSKKIDSKYSNLYCVQFPDAIADEAMDYIKRNFETDSKFIVKSSSEGDRLSSGSHDLNKWLVIRGLATATCAEYSGSQEYSKEQKLGIWSK